MLSPKFVDKLLVTKLTNQLKDMESELQYVRKSLRQLDGDMDDPQSPVCMLSAVSDAIGLYRSEFTGGACSGVAFECLSLTETLSALTIAIEEERDNEHVSN